MAELPSISLEISETEESSSKNNSSIVISSPTIFKVENTQDKSNLVQRRYEFSLPPPEPVSSSSSSSLLGADLSSSSQMPPPKLNTVKKSRNLVNPGKSMVKWMRITQELSNSKGQEGAKLRKIGPDELATHNTLGDVWMAVNDKVFDVSQYTEYHPGGVDELMKGAGEDATALFNNVHRWVNYESILRGHFVGYFVKEPTLGLISVLPTSKFSEDDSSLFLEIDSQTNEDLEENFWTVGILNREQLLLKVVIKPPKIWMTHMKLLKALTDDHIEIRYKNNYKKIQLVLKKPKQEKWLRLGAPLASNNQIMDSRVAVEDLYPAKIVKSEKLNHNVYLFTIAAEQVVLGVPIGFHVQLRIKNCVSRQYTPVSSSLFESNQETINSQNAAGELYFIIKLYPKGQFTSLLSHQLEKDDLQNAELEMGCPAGNFEVSFLHNTKYLFLLAGGTGITPFVRIVQYLQERRQSIPITRVVLLFFNHATDDVIWAEHWKTLASKFPLWFTFYPVISKVGPEENWKGATGRISFSLFEKCVQQTFSEKEINKKKKSTISKAMICGSYEFNAACKKALKQQTVLQFDDPGGIFIFSG